MLIDRIQPRNLLAVTLAATACGYFLQFSSTSLATALPAAVIIGTFGSMSLVIPQTTMQRLIPAWCSAASAPSFSPARRRRLSPARSPGLSSPRRRGRRASRRWPRPPAS
ncbi:MAG TPA: hypothetical protein VFE26_09625 [Trebonia sp.]|nr:hypothetical protein [Trebonia sp.]